jgi:hypothetical protein
MLALAAEPILIESGATLLDGTVIEFTARVPTVEMALVVRAHAYASRREDRDVEASIGSSKSRTLTRTTRASAGGSRKTG